MSAAGCGVYQAGDTAGGEGLFEISLRGTFATSKAGLQDFLISTGSIGIQQAFSGLTRTKSHPAKN